MIPHRVSSRSLSVLIDGRFRTITNQAANFAAIAGMISDGTATEDNLRDLIDIPTFINRITVGRVEVSSGEVLFDGKLMTNYMAQRLIDHMSAGEDIAIYASFIDNVMDNPDESVREDLFRWIENSNMPFTQDGCFIAYKKVDENYNSYHSGRNGKVSHRLGSVVSMPRSECDSNRNQTCSTGLHFCAHSYLSIYEGNAGRIIIVKIHPANVTSIPTDYNLAKGRTCSYTVIGELSPEETKDIFRGRSVMRTFSIFAERESHPAATGDDTILNAPVMVGDFEISSDTDVDDEVEETDVDEVEGNILDDEDEDIIQDDEPEVAEAEELVFTHHGVDFPADVIAKMIEENGQRETSRQTGVPRTTIQTWVQKIKGGA